MYSESNGNNTVNEEIDLYREHLADGDDDCFGYKENAKKVAEQLRKTAPPFVYAICGKWGTGKSSFLVQLIDELPTSNEKALIVYFNAWQGTIYDDILVGFINELIQPLKDCLPVGISKKVQKVAKVLFDTIREVFKDLHVCTKFLNKLYEKSSKSAKEGLSPKAILKERFQQIGGILADNNFTVYVIIDELDRCSPDVAVKMIETLSMIFAADDQLRNKVELHNKSSEEKEQEREVPFKYILSIDEHFLAKSFAHQYDMKLDEAYLYFTKFIQFKYHFPPKKWDIFVAKCLNKHKSLKSSLCYESSNDFVKILELLDTTPREAGRILIYVLDWNRFHFKNSIKNAKVPGNLNEDIRPVVNIFLFLHACVKMIYPSTMPWYVNQKVFKDFIVYKKKDAHTENLEEYIDTKNNESSGAEFLKDHEYVEKLKMLKMLKKCTNNLDELLSQYCKNEDVNIYANAVFEECLKT